MSRSGLPTERAPARPTGARARRPERNQILVDRYQLVSDGFRGSFARVFRAADLVTPGRFVAIRFPADPRDGEHLRRFRRELGTLEALRHPNVVKVVEAHVDHDPPFAVFEYLGGGTLADLLRAGPLPFPAVVLVLGGIAGALGAVHAQGGFHRDVKPQNIMFDVEGRAVLVDWNLASVPQGGEGLSRGFGGTRGYIDPWVANKDFDAAADVYSLAITIAQAATGEPPEELVPELELRIAPRQIAAPNARQAEALVALLEAMVARERRRRPDAALIQEFAAVLANGGGNYPPLPVELPPVARAAERRPLATSPFEGNGHRRLTGVGIAVLLADG